MGNKVCGGCGSDIFQQLWDEYGDKFTKCMVAEKSKDVVHDEFAKLQGKSNGLYEEFHKKSDKMVTEKQQSLN